MDELKDIINKAIKLTPDGQSHVVNMPLLKELLFDLIERISRLETKKSRHDKWLEKQIGKNQT